jgi:hypothetical protein
VLFLSRKSKIFQKRVFSSHFDGRRTGNPLRRIRAMYILLSSFFRHSSVICHSLRISNFEHRSFPLQTSCLSGIH